MRKLIILMLLLLTLCATSQIIEPDLNRKEDLKNLGIGRIIEKDNSILKNITLLEVKEYWIVYVKNESTHDLTMQSIARIEFPESKWGKLIIKFSNNKPEIFWPQY